MFQSINTEQECQEKKVKNEKVVNENQDEREIFNIKTEQGQRMCVEKFTRNS